MEPGHNLHRAISTIVFSLYVLFTLQPGNLADGKDCLYRTNGTCLNLEDTYCPVGFKVEERGCGFKETCCYPTVHEKPTFVYGDAKCGVTSRNWDARIVGGKEAYIQDFPWMVSIQKASRHVCGGSIISDRWILTAAHCVEKNPSYITVLVGSSYSRLGWDAFKERHQVSKIFSHSRFVTKRAALGYDIAMIKLTKPLDLGGTMTRSICLPDDMEDFTDQVCVASGWGHTRESKGPNDSSGSSLTLKQATLPIISKNRCEYYTTKLSKNTICAGYTSGGEDTCQGDSGGPLVCKGKDGVWRQAGIVSTGRGCARKYAMGIYTQVSGFLDWIKQIQDEE